MTIHGIFTVQQRILYVHRHIKNMIHKTLQITSVCACCNKAASARQGVGYPAALRKRTNGSVGKCHFFKTARTEHSRSFQGRAFTPMVTSSDHQDLQWGPLKIEANYVNHPRWLFIRVVSHS